MKKAAAIATLLVVLISDWLALDDITTNPQPSFFWEYAMLIGSVFIFGGIGFFTFQKKSQSEF